MSCPIYVPLVSFNFRVSLLINLAIGVIILSAVLKRRMILADKAKSLFISKYVVSIKFDHSH